MTDFATTSYALLIGIESYQDDTEIPPLDGPANDVYRLALWLWEQKIPAENISVLLSPLEENRKIVEKIQKLLGKKSLPATREKVGKELEQLQQKTNVSLLLFWSGHGFVESGNRRLLYSDATGKSLLNLDLTKQLKAMRSTQYQGICKQVIIVDACANSFRENKFELLGDPLHTVDDEPPNLEQLAMFATDIGEKATNLGIKKMGLFSDKIFEKLDSLPAEKWPLDWAAIMQDIKQEFKDLQKQGRYNQAPKYSLYVMDGDEEHLGRSNAQSLERLIDLSGGSEDRSKLINIIASSKKLRNDKLREIFFKNSSLAEYTNDFDLTGSSKEFAENVVGTLLEMQKLDEFLDWLLKSDGLLPPQGRQFIQEVYQLIEPS